MKPDVGTDLYKRAMKYADETGERGEAMRDVWSVTPYMVDCYTGGTSSDRDCAIRDWCNDHFGKEAWPLHDIKGRWQRGGATIHGWTWMGFATKEDMDKFVNRWVKGSDNEPDET